VKKCNKEFSQKSNYTSHINRKKPCVIDENNEVDEDDEDINIILYRCNKCNKEFNKKYNYLSHIKRKNPCNSKDLINENTILLEKVKKLEKQNSNIKNKDFEEKTNFLQEEILTLKVQIKEKQELLNNNDVEIKNLYKNMNLKKKNNNEEIKIKMVQEYVYIIRECDFVRLNEDIYKIGRTAKINPEDRFQKYRSKANYENEVFIISRY
jgi:hypothetical protein